MDVCKLAFPLALVMAACGGGDTGAGGAGGTGGAGGAGSGPNPETEGCEHFANGPFGTVTADVSPGAAPAIDEHTSYTVILPDLSGGVGAAQYGGYLKLEPVAAGEMVIYLSQDMDFQLYTDDTLNNEIAPEQPRVTAIQDCPAQMATYAVFDLNAEIYVLELAPQEQHSFVGVVLSELEHGHH